MTHSLSAADWLPSLKMSFVNCTTRLSTAVSATVSAVEQMSRLQPWLPVRQTSAVLVAVVDGDDHRQPCSRLGFHSERI